MLPGWVPMENCHNFRCALLRTWQRSLTNSAQSFLFSFVDYVLSLFSSPDVALSSSSILVTKTCCWSTLCSPQIIFLDVKCELCIWQFPAVTCVSGITHQSGKVVLKTDFLEELQTNQSVFYVKAWRSNSLFAKQQQREFMIPLINSETNHYTGPKEMVHSAAPPVTFPPILFFTQTVA